MTTRCAACGYPEAVHEVGTLKCPPETADKNGRRGRLKLPDEVARREWFGLLVPLTEAELKARVAEAVQHDAGGQGPPQVPARPPTGPAEFAGGKGNKQGVKLGRLAVAAGWGVRALYWRAHNGVEGCGIWLNRGPVYALATWKRAAGSVGEMSGWASDIAYAWRTDITDRPPAKLTLTELEGMIK